MMNSLERTIPQLHDTLLDGILGVLSEKSRSELLPVDITEKEDRFILHADVPGIARENIKVNFDKGNLKIEVQARAKHEVKEGEKVVRSERLFNKKTRSFYLGDSINEEAIKATYNDGVLVLDLPKKQSAVTSRQINID